MQQIEERQKSLYCTHETESPCCVTSEPGILYSEARKLQNSLFQLLSSHGTVIFLNEFTWLNYYSCISVYILFWNTRIWDPSGNSLHTLIPNNIMHMCMSY